jgi:hypothetical protein
MNLEHIGFTKCRLEGHDLKYTGEEIKKSKDIKRTRFGIPDDIEHWPVKCTRCDKKMILNLYSKYIS